MQLSWLIDPFKSRVKNEQEHCDSLPDSETAITHLISYTSSVW